ncbi:hypothetical protein TUM4261_16870 [Shewanella sp. c952]|nr:hypothetical protein TUM4261_16870 [Shewanella sp. c952]
MGCSIPEYPLKSDITYANKSKFDAIYIFEDFVSHQSLKCELDPMLIKKHSDNMSQRR